MSAEQEYKCPKCGYEWETILDFEGCPECSRKALTLEDINKLATSFIRAGRRLTDLVVGKQEKEIIKSWAYNSFPSSTKGIFTNEKIKDMMGGSPRYEIFGINLHLMKNAESHFEGFDLSEDNGDFRRFEKIELDKEGMKE